MPHGDATAERVAVPAPAQMDLLAGSENRNASADAAQGSFRDPAFMANRDTPVHRWVPWIAGYSKHFVQDALARFMVAPGVVLDPFAGVGTTLVEADLAGHEAIGFEINPYAAFAARTKLKAHRLSSPKLRAAAQALMAYVQDALHQATPPKTTTPPGFRTRAPFYSPAVERKVLLAMDGIGAEAGLTADVARLAFAATMVNYSNYSYEPSLGRKAAVGRPDVADFPVVETLAAKMEQMAEDATWYRRQRATRRRRDGRIIEKSFFDGHRDLRAGSVDLLVTSPPYLNNYHYGRNTRPHLYWLGFCAAPSDLKRLEALNFGTYWQNARDRDEVALDTTILDEEIRETLRQVRQRNADKGIYGGHGWANYAALYFNDCVRFAKGAKWCLRSGGTALVVIGNSILQGVPVPTDRFLARIAETCGLAVVDIHRPRQTRVGNSIVNSSVRAGAATGERLYESVLELRCS